VLQAPELENKPPNEERTVDRDCFDAYGRFATTSTEILHGDAELFHRHNYGALNAP
jgi:hypothetical protein